MRFLTYTATFLRHIGTIMQDVFVYVSSLASTMKSVGIAG